MIGVNQCGLSECEQKEDTQWDGMDAVADKADMCTDEDRARVRTRRCHTVDSGK